MTKIHQASNAMTIGYCIFVFACIAMHLAGCSKSEKNDEFTGRWELDGRTVPGGFPIKLPAAGGNITKYRIDITKEIFTFRVDVDLNVFGSSALSFQSPWKYDGQNFFLKGNNGNELRIAAKKSGEGIMALGAHPGKLSDLIFITDGGDTELKRTAAQSELLKAFEAAINPPIKLIKKQENPQVGDLSSP